MSYIGNTATQQAFTPAVDFFNGNGSTTAFTLSRPVASVAQVQVVISNVPQKPGDAYTVSGNTITFTSAPPSGTQNIYVYYTSPITQVIAPGQGTVGTAQIQNGAVIPADLSTGAPTWDTSGNVGVGVTPSAWTTSFGLKALQVGPRSSLVGTTSNTNVSHNNYFDGTNVRYIASAAASYYLQDNGSHIWYTAPSGTAGNVAAFTQAMTLTAAGNLGIGTTNPNVAGGTRAITLDAPTAGNYSGFELMTGGTLRAKFIGNSSQTYFGTETATPLILVMGGSERARIDTDGNFLVGATSIPTGSSSFASGNSFFTGGNILINNSGGTSTYFFRWDGYVNSLYGLWSNGSADAGVKLDYGSTSWSSSSDERLKDIIEPIANAVEKVCTLRSVIGKYKTDEADKRRAFLIAQDVQAVLPEAVSESAPPNVEETSLWLNYQDVIPLLVAAIKEQQAIIETLTNRITALESK